MPINPIELSRQFSYDALASFLKIDHRQVRDPRPSTDGDGTPSSSDDARDATSAARARVREFLELSGRPIQS